MSGFRVLFDDEEPARRVADRLRSDGFAVDVRREAFAGEDDDEDRAWAVLTDAPAVMAELAAEEAGGWVEYDADPATAPTPLDLPGMPRRHHRDPDLG